MDPRYGIELLRANLKAGVVKVLVIDDDADICNGLKDILQDAGYHVETADCAADGRDHFDEQTFSILVVDYSLPDANGIEIARMVRAHYPWVQTILMTGHDRVEISKNHENSPLLGAFLRKPIDVQTILSVMEQMLHRQCDHFQIARFSPQREPDPPAMAPPPKGATPVPQPVSVPAPAKPVESIPQKNKWPLSPVTVSVFIVGLAVGWYGHDILKRPHAAVQKIAPIPVAIPVAAAAPIEIQMEDKLPPPVPEPAPAPVDWNSQLDSDDESLRLRAAQALLKESPNHKKATAALLELIGDPDSDPAIVKASQETLNRLGNSTLSALKANAQIQPAK